ncbi:hypothetical protein KC640_01960 [Candidatus Dojkabacteria bacterium]|uniref:Cohesin domain-containing protein n=1 Tax=Candidatus Dojkabacteria bacterium TaxID=2099670 RepID=A0A955I772_9BACT|nr:hypothetical protein [Candidatus Dojkabacteria bacterium]
MSRRRYQIITVPILAAVFALLPMLVGANLVSAARFYFDPPTSALSSQCTTFTVSVMMDTQGQSVNAADIEIYYSPGQVSLVDYNTIVAGTQIGTGNAFESYRANQVSGSSIKLVGSSFTQNLNGIAKFAEIQFSRIGSVSSTGFQVRFDGIGASLDSNIVSATSGTDILSSVTNATYSFNNVVCPEVVSTDKTSPVITMESPVNKSVGVALDSAVEFRLRDSASGVNIGTLQIEIAGQTYTNASPEVVVSGTAADYTVIVTPASPFPFGQLVNVEVSVDDSAGNNGLTVFSFNEPDNQKTDITPPSVTLLSPLDGAQGVSLDSSVQLRIRDLESGVNINSLEIILGGVTYAYDDPSVTINGSLNDYTVEVNPVQDFPVDTPISIEVSVADVTGNAGITDFKFNEPIPQVVVVPPQSAVEEAVKDAVDSIFSPPEDPFKDTFLQDTPIEQFVEETGTVGASNVLVTTLLLFNMLSFVNILTTPALLVGVLRLIFKRKRDKTWGIIFDGQTNRPVAFAVTRLYIAETTTLIEQRVSDTNGRYGFVVASGNYRLEVTHSDYSTVKKEIIIDQDSPGYNLDIRLIPKTMVGTGQKLKFFESLGVQFRKFVRTLSPYLFLAGFLLSLISVSLTPSTFNLALLVLYSVLLISLLLGKLTNRGKSASVADSETGLRIPGAIVKIYNVKNFELMDSQITNALGRFDFWGDPGEYGVLVTARGYRFPSRLQKDLKPIENKYSGMLRVPFKRNQKITLLVDPQVNLSDTQLLSDNIQAKKVAKVEGQGATGQLQTPFG